MTCSTHLDPRALLFPPSSPIYNSAPLRNILWHLHGTLLTISFLILFPLGVLAIRSTSPHAFRRHYLLQLSASVLALAGIFVGIATSSAIVLLHQYLGLALGLLLFLQVLAGWRHHVGFVRKKGKTWWSPLHVWLGRGMMGVAWVNVFLGMRLREYGFLAVGGAVVVMGGMATLWVAWAFGMVRWGKGKRGGSAIKRGLADEREEEEEGRVGLMGAAAREDDFALDDIDDEGASEIGDERDVKTAKL